MIPIFSKICFLLCPLFLVVVIAGDFNCTLDPVKDKSSGVDQSHPRSRGIIHYFMKEMNLIDIWREANPNDLKFMLLWSTPVLFTY